MNPIKANDITPMIRGDVYRNTHKASVIGILGSKAPRVSSRGSKFYNRDRWTVRVVTLEMCKWAYANPGCIPTRDDIKKWINAANARRVYDPEIVIANTPNQLPLRVALALTGGAYHEAWHTLYSRREDLTVEEVATLVLPRWALLKDWSCYHEILQEWSNIVEDIRIERRGREDFEGTYIKMCDLQDFILDMEEKGEESARSHGGKPHALTVVTGVFRDIGLGYNTEKQRAALERYQKDNSQAVQLVKSGPLAPLLREAIDLDKKDDTGCLRIAMEVLSKLSELSKDSQESEDQGKDGKPGDGKQKCPICGAPGHKLIVRPKSDGKGGKVKGIGIVTCTICGWQAEIPVTIKPPKKNPDKSTGKKEKGPKFEGFDESDITDPEDEDEKGEEGEEGEGEGQEGKDGEKGKKGKGKKGSKDKKGDKDKGNEGEEEEEGEEGEGEGETGS
ncbi:MAG: hypothetical protein WC824_15135, partial [Bacteroidota bacterium]